MINFEQINSFLLIGSQLEKINPLHAYYFKYYATKKALEFILKNFNLPNFKKLDQQVTMIRTDITILVNKHKLQLNQKEDLALLEDAALKLFFDIDDKDGSINQLNDWIFCAMSLMVISFLNPSRKDLKEKQLYSQHKSIQQFIKFKTITNSVTNFKVHLFDFQLQEIDRPMSQSSNPPAIIAPKTQMQKQIENLQKSCKQNIIDGLSELEFKVYPQSLKKIKLALDDLAQLQKLTQF